MARRAASARPRKIGGAGRAPVHNDAEEAMEDTQAEIMIRLLRSMLIRVPANPQVLLQRRLDKAKLEAETAIKEKETMQKKLDALQAELELAKSNVGDVVQIAQNPLSTPARKVCLVSSWRRLKLVLII